MKVEFNIKPGKNYQKMKKAVSKEIYKGNGYSKAFMICDILASAFFGAFATLLYDCYEILYDWFYYYDKFVPFCCIILCPFVLFYTLFIRHILWLKAFKFASF